MTPSLPALVLHAVAEHPGTLRCALIRDGGELPPATSLGASPDVRLPVESASLAAIILPGVLEWLAAPDAYGLLLDCHRALAAGGHLVADVPDADAALAAWRRGDAEAIRCAAAPPEDEIQTWPARGIPDTLDTRTAARFCTYRGPSAPGYLGPPILDAPVLRGLLERWSPFRLAVELHHALLETEPRFERHRQSTWGRDELAVDLERVGFLPPSFERTDVAAVLASLPGGTPPLGDGRLWCVARPAFPASRPGLSAQDELRECQQALALRAGHALRHYRMLWARFGRAIEETARAAPAEPSFRKRGYFLEQLPWDALHAFHASLAQVPSIRLTVNDYAPGYSYNDALSDEAAAVFNQCSTYLLLGQEQRRRLAPVLQALAVPVRACLGTGFRVVNMRCWKTPTGSVREESQTWHKDELYPRETLKAMIYLSRVGPEFGSTELAQGDGARVVPEGPPGTLLLFRNSVLTHRGVPPRGHERTVLEFTLAPWPEDDLRPRSGGLNAEFPILPWDPLEGT
jgi:hypothetical protein